MQQLLILGAVLVLALLLPALAHREHRDVIRRSWADPLGLLRGLWLEEVGVVVITYLFPTGAANATPPTAIQASQVPTQTAQVFFADTDAQAVVVHNMQLGPSAPFFLFPEIIMTKSLGGGSDSSFATNFTFVLTNTNSITINKLSVGTGSGGTYNLVIRRPHSIGL